MDKLYSRPSFGEPYQERQGQKTEPYCAHVHPMRPPKVVERNKFKLTVKGTQGVAGADGLSAYQIAVKNGFEGTEAEWLENIYIPTLKGLPELVENWLNPQEDPNNLI